MKWLCNGIFSVGRGAAKLALSVMLEP
jgi:hypothetical protein